MADIPRTRFLNGFFIENILISIGISMKCFPMDRFNIIALVQIMVWRWSGDRPSYRPMFVSLLTHICVTRPRYDNANIAINWTLCFSELVLDYLRIYLNAFFIAYISYHLLLEFNQNLSTIKILWSVIQHNDYFRILCLSFSFVFVFQGNCSEHNCLVCHNQINHQFYTALSVELI